MCWLSSLKNIKNNFPKKKLLAKLCCTDFLTHTQHEKPQFNYLSPKKKKKEKDFSFSGPEQQEQQYKFNWKGYWF